jgi:hypothetical protein
MNIDTISSNVFGWVRGDVHGVVTPLRLVKPESICLCILRPLSMDTLT